MNDQGTCWGRWWGTQKSLFKAIDMSLEKIGQPILFNTIYLATKGRQWLLCKIKLEPIWLVQKWIVIEKTYRNCQLSATFLGIVQYDIMISLIYCFNHQHLKSCKLSLSEFYY